MRTLAMLAAVVWLGAAPAWADALPGPARKQLQLYWQSRDPGGLADLTGTDLLSFYIHDRLVEEQTPGRISINALRNDLQLGAFSAGGASTSIVARPGLTDVISAAMESGAAVRTGDDTAITWSFGALPLSQLMAGRMPTGCGSYDEICREGVGRWIRGLSGSVSLDLSHPATPEPTGTGRGPDAPSPGSFVLGGRTLSALSARYELFVRERKAKDEAALDAAAAELSAKAEAFLAGQEGFETRLESVLGQAGWKAETQRALQGATSLALMEEVLLTRYRMAWSLFMTSAELQRMAAAVFPEKLKYVAAQNKVLAEKLYRKALSVDYVHQRPIDQPWLHQVRLAASAPLGGKPSDDRISESRTAAIPPVSVTLNAGVTLYHSISGSNLSGKPRDAQASVAIDWSPAGPLRLRPTYTVAYYYQFMLENGVIQFDREAVTPGGAAIALPGPAVEVLNTTGPIHVAQFRVNIPIGATGVSFPVAFSYSSRTELIVGKSFWQGHAGVTYDLSRLKSLVKPTPAP